MAATAAAGQTAGRGKGGREEENEGERRESGLAYVGLLEQLKALILPPADYDGAMMIVDTAYPMVVVQSTEDVFIDPKVASVYSPSQLPPEERIMITEITAKTMQAADDDDQRAVVFLSWLKAGHEVIQERTSYLLSLMSQLAREDLWLTTCQ